MVVGDWPAGRYAILKPETGCPQGSWFDFDDVNEIQDEVQVEAFFTGINQPEMNNFPCGTHLHGMYHSLCVCVYFLSVCVFLQCVCACVRACIHACVRACVRVWIVHV